MEFGYAISVQHASASTVNCDFTNTFSGQGNYLRAFKTKQNKTKPSQAINGVYRIYLVLVCKALAVILKDICQKSIYDSITLIVVDIKRQRRKQGPS